MIIQIDEETQALAGRLARLRGETVAQALNAAVRDALRVMEPAARIGQAKPLGLDPANPLASLTPAQRAKVERSLASTDLLPELPSGDPTDDLYDENGLPH